MNQITRENNFVLLPVMDLIIKEGFLFGAS
jgi:hypothetical protein